MEINRVNSSNASIQKQVTDLRKTDSDNGGLEIKDEVTLSGKDTNRSMLDLLNLKNEKVFKTRSINTHNTLEPVTFPNSSNETRSNSPIIIVHGTGADHLSMTDYQEAALENGHPADIGTYLTIKKGDRMEKSAEILAEKINKDRIAVAKQNLRQITAIKNDPAKLKEFFSFNSNLYGKNDPSVDKIFSLLPGVVNHLDEIIKTSGTDLDGKFSGKLKNFEGNLAEQIKNTGFAGDIKDSEKLDGVCKKAASEIIETIAPKAVLIGHSMGGFVSYLVSVNPQDGQKPENPLGFDGGNGVSTVIALSSPVGKGLRSPLPIGVANYAFDLLDKNILNPMEGAPGIQLAMVNPFFSGWYILNKELTKESLKAMSINTQNLMNPITNSLHPGYEQIMEGSSFIRQNLENRKIPEGVTVISITSKNDGISEADRSQVDDSQKNGFNLDVDVALSEKFAKSPLSSPSVLTHFTMARYPFERGKEFKKEILENPVQIPKLLDRRNHDGIRFSCLRTLFENVKNDPLYFDKPENKDLIGSIKDVEEEKLPFKNSPSYLAHQILKAVAKDK